MKGFYEQMLMSLTDGDWEFLTLSARMGLETYHMPPGDFSRQNVKAATRLVSSVFTSRNIGFRNLAYEISSKAALLTEVSLHVLSKI